MFYLSMFVNEYPFRTGWMIELDEWLLNECVISYPYMEDRWRVAKLDKKFNFIQQKWGRLQSSKPVRHNASKQWVLIILGTLCSVHNIIIIIVIIIFSIICTRTQTIHTYTDHTHVHRPYTRKQTIHTYTDHTHVHRPILLNKLIVQVRFKLFAL